MPGTTKIEWAEATWNPVTGCTKVSPGCAHCYAETFAERWRGVEGHPYEHGFDLTLRPERLDQPSRWKKPRLIFVNSMSDLFHEGIPDEFIEHVYEEMIAANHHVYQVLTKRSERLAEMTAAGDWDYAHDDSIVSWGRGSIGEKISEFFVGDPKQEAEHIWHGVSVESQRYASERIPDLIEVPSVGTFLSCEPLLGPLDLAEYLPSIQWVIVGGESGRDARPMNPDWARSIRDQCLDASVPFFFKQWGEWLPLDQVDADGRAARTNQFNNYARMGKRRAGRTLDGELHDANPAAEMLVLRTAERNVR